MHMYFLNRQMWNTKARWYMFLIRRAAKIVSKYLVFANGCIMYITAGCAHI